MNFNKKKHENQVGFQMAPMVDIMFLMLVFFMAITFFAKWEKHMGINVPATKAGDANSRQAGEIIINVDKDGKIFVNEAEMSLKRLEQLLERVSIANENQSVIIRADAKSTHGINMKILAACKNAGITNPKFSTIDEKK